MVCLSVVGCCSIWCLPLAPWQSRRCCWSWSSCDEGTVYDESADDHKTSFVLGAISYCNSVSPGFTTFNPTAQAPCLCYSSTSWAPGLFDGVAVTCANYISTAVSSDYSIFSALAGFCISVGDVLNSLPSAAATTTPSGRSSRFFITTTTAAGTAASSAVPTDCSLVQDALSYCESVTPGFLTFNPTYQAPCLCYSSASWAPDVFDRAMTTCGNYASTANPSDYSVFSTFAGFCTSVGDVGNPPTGAAPSTTARIASSTASRALVTSCPATSAPLVVIENSVTSAISSRPSTSTGSSTTPTTAPVVTTTNGSDARPVIYVSRSNLHSGFLCPYNAGTVD